MGFLGNCQGMSEAQADHIKLAGVPVSGVSLQWIAGTPSKVKRLDGLSFATLGFVAGCAVIGSGGPHAGQGGVVSGLETGSQPNDTLVFDDDNLFGAVVNGTSSATALYPIVDTGSMYEVQRYDRILDISDPDSTKHGPWVCDAPAWRRPFDANSSTKLRKGKAFFVENVLSGLPHAYILVSGQLGSAMEFSSILDDLTEQPGSNGGVDFVNDVAGNLTMTPRRAYCVNGGGQPELKLPAADMSSDGDYIEVHGRSNPFSIVQDVGTIVRFGSVSTVAGESGRIDSRGPYDFIALRNLGGNEWKVVQARGSFFVAGTTSMGVQTALEPVRVTTAQTGGNAMKPGRSYIVDAGASIDMEIFGEGRPGDEIEVVGYAGGYVIKQPDNSTECFAGASATSQGAVGTITPAHARNSIRLRCVSYRKWIVTATQGAHTLA